MVSGSIPKPPRVTPRGNDFPSNYVSATTKASWKAVVVLCGLLGALVLIFLLAPLRW